MALLMLRDVRDPTKAASSNDDKSKEDTASDLNSPNINRNNNIDSSKHNNHIIDNNIEDDDDNNDIDNSFDNEACTHVLCNSDEYVEQPRCPVDSRMIQLEESNIIAKKCCGGHPSNATTCDCLPCPNTKTLCKPPQFLQLSQNVTKKPGTCCDKYHCVDKETYCYGIQCNDNSTFTCPDDSELVPVGEFDICCMKSMGNFSRNIFFEYSTLASVCCASQQSERDENDACQMIGTTGTTAAAGRASWGRMFGNYLNGVMGWNYAEIISGVIIYLPRVGFTVSSGSSFFQNC
ncbi:hypothetical protein HELRODRAFT_161146 [Helobdella robusta]|uniref:Uncharacterized protein n=1 Tax=Helobdella robusta TaxID=6412 RepID=T1ER54_HELRO|nr:hypothetical protein HELRODRAFT_161146 [Helobdella robusta]ESO01940.1 hypothetical protein HELRODRAFT_161146 [Helobdella robusta]